MYVSLSVSLSVCLSVCPSVRPSVRPSIHPSVRPSVRPSIRPSVRPSVRLSVCLSVCLSLSVVDFAERRPIQEFTELYVRADFHCLTPVLMHAQCNLVTLGRRLPLQPSAVGNRSLMWAYHITGTPGCSTPKVDTSTPWGNDRGRAQRSANIH